MNSIRLDLGGNIGMGAEEEGNLALLHHRLQPRGGTANLIGIGIRQAQAHRRDVTPLDRPRKRGGKRLQLEALGCEEVKPAGRRVSGIGDGRQALPE
jgi:hypothetical protein